MAKLYEISEKLRNLKEIWMSCIDEETGEFDETKQQEIDEMLEIIKEELNSKAESVATYILNEQSDLVALENEKKRITNRVKKQNAHIQSFLSYVKTCMMKMGENEIKTPLATMKIQKNRPSVVIYDPSKLSEEFLVAKYEPSKTKIKEAIDNGIEVAGAYIESNSTSLKIK